VENAEKNPCVGSIFGNQFHFLLMRLLTVAIVGFLKSSSIVALLKLCCIH